MNRHKLKLIICFMVSLILIAGLTERSWGMNVKGAKAVRYLSDYKCADGTVPDGIDKNHDDTSALRAALADGPGIVQIGPGFFRFGNVSIPEKITVAGAGTATIIRSNGEDRIFYQKGVGGWGLKDLMLDGETDKAPFAVPDNRKQGLAVIKSYAFIISNVTACRFEGVAIEFSNTDLKSAAFCNGGTVSGLTVYSNYAGLSFSKRAEYITATQIKSYKNTYGCVINGGNNSIGESHFCENMCGILIEDMENGSHGSINSCLINHNRQYAILAKKVLNGFNIVGCNIFYGTVELMECKGIKISSGSLGCNSLIVKGEFMNQISGNYIVTGLLKQYDINKQTILKDNFTDKEIWIPSAQ